MKYQVKTIRSKEEIGQCEKFEITNYMWNSTQTPKAYGRMGYLEGQGFYVEMICEEKNPKRTFLHFKDAVYRDSAMEAFLAFPEKGEALTNDVMYLNFEANANGALYAAYGKGRKGRQFMPEEYLPLCGCRADVQEERWMLSFLIPEKYLRQVCGVGPLDGELEFYCNFYKISESAEIEHYGSFSRIESEKPNFHLPVCFARAQIV